MSRFVSSLLIIILALAACMAMAEQSQAPQTTMEQKRAAVECMRAINTAEMRFRNTNNRFAGSEELSSSGLIDGCDLASPPAGFEVRLLSQGSTYQAALVGTSGWSLFSDEHGLIYQGEPLK